MPLCAAAAPWTPASSDEGGRDPHRPARPDTARMHIIVLVFPFSAVSIFFKEKKWCCTSSSGLFSPEDIYCYCQLDY